MLYRAWIIFLWVVLLLLVALEAWGLVLYFGLPLWWVPLSFVVVVLLILAGRWGVRCWSAWRLRARMNAELPLTHRSPASTVDQDWTAGVRLLRQSRLGRVGSPLYALPWFLLLGEQCGAKNSLLSQSGLVSALRPVDHPGAAVRSAALDWWFLDRGVVIDPSGAMLEGSSATNVEWKRLLRWLLRSRQREPLNGVVMVIDCDRLLGALDDRLAEQGQNLRQRLDDLVRVFGVRVPVYFIITGAEALPGFALWSADLTPVQREQPFGLLSQGSDSSAVAFLDEMLHGLGQRLSDLRIEQGVRGLPDEQVFGLPERIAGLRPGLEKLLLPAFSANPYSEPPLLGGLFLTAQAPAQEGQREGWFSHHLLGQLLPAQRYAYQPIVSWQRWRRLLTHLAVIVWLGLCVSAGGLLVYADRHTQAVLAEASNEQPLVVGQHGDLETRLDALRRFSHAIVELSDKELGGWKSLLPFSHYIKTFQAERRADYVRYFIDEIRRPVFDERISKNLKSALSSGDPRLIAAYAEFFVRRINMLDARLNNRPLAELKQRPELGLLYQVYGSKVMISPAQMASISESYADYLTWQTDLNQLQDQRADLLVQLDSMGLENQTHTWLTAWAEQQGDLPPIRLSEYWRDEANPPVMLSGAYTVQGRYAILGFIDEIGRASRNQDVWKAQRERFMNQYQDDTQHGWYQFIQRFLLSAQTRLKNQDDWQQVLSVVGTDNDPFLKLLHRSAERFELIPVDQRAAWATRTVTISRLLKLANQSDLNNESAALSNLKVTNAVGGDVLKGIVKSGSVTGGVSQIRLELAQAKSMAKFQQLIMTVTADLKKSDAKAFQVALDTWGYASNPQVKAAPLWQARDIRDKLALALDEASPKEDVVWALATGSLDFSVAYAGQIAACQLQRDWNGQLLSVIEGVQDPVVLNTLLYGERGQLPAFMSGPVNTFIQRTMQRYTPREVLGGEVPLTAGFYAYVGRMQHAQTSIASAERQSQVVQATRQQNKQALGVEQKALQTQQVELQQQLAVLQATTAAVELSTTASQVNLGARQLPQRTRLSMQCSGRSTVLDNYNFPTSASFIWAPKACSDVSLEIMFSGFKLVRHWTGERAFIDFLRTFSEGQHTFIPDDFPNQRDLMGSENLTRIQLTYRQQGEKTLMESYAQADQVQVQVSSVNSRLKVISEQLVAIDTQVAAQEVSLATAGAPVQQGLANIRPPVQIAGCWTPKPMAATSSGSNTGQLDVGIYHSDARIKRLEAQLHIMGYDTRREVLPSPVGQHLQKLMVVGLTDTTAAGKAIDELVRTLDAAAQDGAFKKALPL